MATYNSQTEQTAIMLMQHKPKYRVIERIVSSMLAVTLYLSRENYALRTAVVIVGLGMLFAFSMRLRPCNIDSINHLRGTLMMVRFISPPLIILAFFLRSISDLFIYFYFVIIILQMAIWGAIAGQIAVSQELTPYSALTYLLVGIGVISIGSTVVFNAIYKNGSHWLRDETSTLNLNVKQLKHARARNASASIMKKNTVAPSVASMTTSMETTSQHPNATPSQSNSEMHPQSPESNQDTTSDASHRAAIHIVEFMVASEAPTEAHLEARSIDAAFDAELKFHTSMS
jgi:hypothetical protein